MTSSASQFTADQYAHAYPPSMQDHYWSLARCACVYRKLIKFGLKSQKLLEIGCGTGIVVANLQARQIDIIGCELADIPKHALLSDDIATGICAFDLPQAEREGYTVVLLLDVLEHLEDRSAFLDKVYAHFPNVDDLIITVPARQELWSNYDDFYGHKLRYDRPGMRDEIAKTKWHVLGNSYFFHLIYWPTRVLLKVTKQRDVKLAGPVGAAKIIHRCVAGVFSLEAKLVPGWVPGTSLMTHVKRRS